MSGKKLVYVINHTAFFVSHRLPLAIAAKKKGWDVLLITGQEGSKVMGKSAEEKLRIHDINHKRVAFTTIGLNPFREILGLIQIFFIVKKYRPDVMHTASPKGNLYGGIIARISGVKGLVVAISGMGFLFTGKSGILKRIAGKIYVKFISIVYSHPNIKIIVQNHDDSDLLINSGIVDKSNVTLIPGSGVELDRYLNISEEESQNLVILPARMLKDKGVLEFVEAVKILKHRGINWQFILVGAADYLNPTSVPREKIEGWVNDGIIDWWGHQEDMFEAYSQAGIVCLPSYREGMPKTLLEAAAAGRAVVTTNVTGCREAILPGKTGLLVNARDSSGLADALEILIRNPKKRLDFGRAGRKLAIEKFDLKIITKDIMNIYSEIST